MSDLRNTNYSDFQKIASSTFGPMFNPGMFNPAMFSPALFNPALAAMLRAQASFLAGMEQAMIAWVRHRREALAEAESVLARMQGCQNPAEIWGLQQEWIGHAVQRLSEGAAECQKAVMSFAAAGPNGQSEARQPEPVAAVPDTRVKKVPAAGN